MTEKTWIGKNHLAAALMKAPVLLVAALVLSRGITAGGAERRDSLSVMVYFRTGSTVLDTEFRDNSLFLGNFVREVKAVMSDTTCRIQDIYIRSAASPEGSFDNNLRLSRGRGLALRDYLRAELMISDDRFVVDHVGEDWESLREQVKKRDVPDKERILEILGRYGRYIEGNPATVIGGPKKELMDLNGGRTWFWLERNIFPDLRNAGNSVVCRYVRTEPAPQPSRVGHVIDTIIIEHHHYHEVAVPASGDGSSLYPAAGADQGRYRTVRLRRVRKGPAYRFALKTNLLFDAALIPNIEMEFPVGRRVSLLAHHDFAWYLWDSDRFAHEFLNSGAEVRVWLGDRDRRPVLTGCYVGLYGATGKADLELKGKGVQVPRTWHAGVTAGWSFPLGKRDNWRLDLGLGLGYLPYRYYRYEKSETSGLLMVRSAGTGRWIGPTNLRCTLVWMLPMTGKEGAASKNKSKRNEK